MLSGLQQKKKSRVLACITTRKQSLACKLTLCLSTAQRHQSRHCHADLASIYHHAHCFLPTVTILLATNSGLRPKHLVMQQLLNGLEPSRS